MARQVVVIPELRIDALRASGVFPRSWGVGVQGTADDDLPTIVSASELRKRLNANDEAWLGRHFQSGGGSVLASWIAFVDEAGGEHGALHQIRSLQRRLHDRLGAALGYRTDELNHLTILVDDEADQGLDDDRKLVPRVRHAWTELRMSGPLFYMGPRMNSVEDVPLAASSAWPVSVSTLLLALHVTDRPESTVPREGIHAWRGVAWRPWSTEEAARMRRELSRLTSELLAPRSKASSTADPRSENRLREELGREGGIEIPFPSALGRPSTAGSDSNQVVGALRRFDRSGSTVDYGREIRATRQAAAAKDHERQHSLWTLGWDVAEVRPLGARRARQVLEEIPIAGEDSEDSATRAAGKYHDLCAAEQRLNEQRAEVEGCANHIEFAERGRIGPAARLAVAVAVVALLAYAIWFLAEGVLGLTGIAVWLLVAMGSGAVTAVITLTILEAAALRRARREFHERLIPGLYSARSQLTHDRAGLMGAASEQRFRIHDRSTRSALHAQLDRLGRLVDGALGLAREEEYTTGGTFTAPDPRVSRCFLPHLYEELPANPDPSRMEEPVRRSLGKTTERWARFVSDHDPHRHGDVPAALLVAELGQETARLRMDAFRQQIARLGEDLPDRLLRESEKVSLESFISGLSHRQEGRCDQPLQWTSLTDVPDLQRHWNVDEACADRLRALGFIGLRLDHKELASRQDDQEPGAAR